MLRGVARKGVWLDTGGPGKGSRARRAVKSTGGRKSLTHLGNFSSCLKYIWLYPLLWLRYLCHLHQSFEIGHFSVLCHRERAGSWRKITAGWQGSLPSVCRLRDGRRSGLGRAKLSAQEAQSGGKGSKGSDSPVKPEPCWSSSECS